MSTRVVNVKLSEPFDVYIGRTMKHGYYGKHPVYQDKGWGNPFRAGYNAVSAADVLNHYRVYLLHQPKLLARIVPELRGKTLGCWCAPPGGLDGDLGGRVCHGEILAALADDPSPAETLREWLRIHKVRDAPMQIESLATRRGFSSHHPHTWHPWASDPRFEHCVCGASRRVDLAPVVEPDPRAVRCPHCGAAPGEPCIGPRGITHARRAARAQRLAKRQATETEVAS